MKETQPKETLDAAYIKQAHSNAVLPMVWTRPYKLQPMFVLYGKGNNGKSALMEAMSDGMKRRIQVEGGE